MNKNLDTLDLLINRSFLELDFDQKVNEVILDASLNFHLNSANFAAETNTNWLEKSITHLKSKFYLYLLGIIGIASIYVISKNEFIGGNNDYGNNRLPVLEVNLNPDSTIDSMQQIKKYGRINSISKSHNRNLTPLKAPKIGQLQDSSIPIEMVDDEKIIIYLNPKEKLPELTTEEIAQNNSIKQKLLKQLIKLDKKCYALIEIKKEENTSDNDMLLKPFYMQTTEVSNLEYRTFLNDLIIQGKREAYFIARPDESKWQMDSLEYNQPLVEQYFTHEAYNKYPVVNISRQAAILYCNWLLDLVGSADKNKYEISEIRLPSDKEWMFAASGGKEYYKYPWGGPYVRNSEGCFLANFRPYKDDYLADGGLHTVTVKSYSANHFGLYCMAGNVAEMVSYDDGSIGTKGGSWTSVALDMQINAPRDTFKGIEEANRNIGFRPAIFLDDEDL